MQYYSFNKSGYYEADVLAETMPINCTDIRPPQPCYMPRWDGKQWIEDAPPPTHDPETEIAIWDSETKEWHVEPKTDIPEPTEYALKTEVNELREALLIAMEGLTDE